MAVFSLIGSLISGIASAASTAASAVGAGTSAAAGAAGTTGGLSLGGALGAVSAAAGIGGTVMQAVGASKAHAAQEKAEKLRSIQMNLQADRERRQMVRQAIIQRAQVSNQAGATGQPNSSGLQSGLSNITSQTGRNILGVNTGQQLGNQMFEINRQISSGQTLASIGGAVRGIGNMFAQNSQQFDRVWG